MVPSIDQEPVHQILHERRQTKGLGIKVQGLVGV